MLWIIWLVIAAIFIALAYFHWRASKKIFPTFQLPEIPYWKPSKGIPVNTGILDSDIKKAFDNFKDGLNSYINDYNKSSSKQNRLQALGYMIAFLAAIFSLILTIPCRP